MAQGWDANGNLVQLNANGQPAGPPGWSLNPLTDIQKASSGIGDFINQHTGIGGFNPGIGSAVSTIGGIVPGIANLGIAALTPWNQTSQNRLQAAGTGLLHGAEDTATDVATLGGTVPGWTGAVENAVGQLPGSYTPQTLKQYSTEKGGPGLLGGALNDFANLAMGAGAVAKFAKAGELGEAATAAMSADHAAQLEAAAKGGLPGDVAQAGQTARLTAADAAATDTASVLQRAQLLDRLNVVRQGADVAFNPFRAYQSLIAPLGRAAVLADVPEAGLTTEASRLPAEPTPVAEPVSGTGTPEPAPVAQTATQGVSGQPAPEPVPAGAPGYQVDPELLKMQEEASRAVTEGRPTGAPEPVDPAVARQQALEGVKNPVTLYRGQPVDPNVPVGTDNWTTTRAEAESHAAATGGQVMETQVPPEVAQAAHEASVARQGLGGTEGTSVHDLPPEWANLAQPEAPLAVSRFERAGVTLAEAANSPGGAYTSLAGDENPHGGQNPGSTLAHGTVTPTNALDVSAETGKLGLKAGENAATLAIRKLLGAAGADRVFSLSDAELEAELKSRFGIDGSTLNGRTEVLDAYGAQLAKAAGHDAIIYHAPDPRYSEAVALKPSAISEGGPVNPANGAPVTPKVAEELAQRNRDMGPTEAQANLSRAKGVPDWANKVVNMLPSGAQKLLRAMEYRNQAHTVANVITEAGRTQRMAAAREMHEPWFQAHVDLAHSLIGEEDASGKKIDPSTADRAVGERVQAAMTSPTYHAMEELRPQLDAIEPHAVEKAFGFETVLPPELNTPEFRAQVQNVADLATAHLEGRGQFAATSPYLGARGLEGMDVTSPTMTGTQQANLKAALEARIAAHEATGNVPAELTAAQEQIATHEAAAEQASRDIGVAHQAAGEALTRITENRQGPPITEGEPGPVGEPGKITPAEPAPGNLSAKQQVSSAPGRPGEAGRAAYQRGLDAQQALEDYQGAQASEREAYGRMLEAHKNVADMQASIANASLPSQMAAAALHGKSEALLARLQDEMNNTPVNRVPPIYQPAVRAALEIARMVKDNPELADVLAEAPKNFADVVRYSADHGFDPVHISEMTEEKARRFAMGTASLSPDLGKQEIGLFRKGRTGALATAGLDSRTAAGMAAQWASVLHEDRVNAIADTVDRLYAIPGEKNHLGQTVNPNPKELVPWDAQRRGLLATTKASTGGEQLAVQARSFIPRAVANTIDAYSKDHSNLLQRALAKTTDPWRTLVLTMSPKFYVNHMIGHIILGAVQGVSLPQWVAAWKEARSGFANFPELTKSGIYQAETGPRGLVGYDSVTQAREQGGIRAAVGAGTQKLSNAVNTVDAFAKAALAIHGVAKGLSRDEALHFAQIAGVDYGALSPFESQVVRSVIPFYSFEKGVLKIVMQYPLDHPVAANMLMQIGREQQALSVDANGNPLPTAYQDIVKIPGLGNLNMKSLTPFKDVGSLLTATGLVNSMQFVVQAGIKSGLGIANPGQKVGVKVGPTGALIPDVPLLPTLAASLSATPQGALLGGGSPASFAGVPTVKQSTLDNAGARNALSQGEKTAPMAMQNKATAFPVDANLLQNSLSQSISAPGGPLALSGALGTTPGQTPATSTTATTPQVQAALAAQVTKQQLAAATTRAANKAAGKSTGHKGGGSHHVRVASNKPRSPSHGRTSGGKASGGKARRVSGGGTGGKVKAGKVAGTTPKSSALRSRLSQGFGKASNARRSGGGHAGAIFKSSAKGVAGMGHKHTKAG